jgi:molecular chaperone DnaK (HSP70)
MKLGVDFGTTRLVVAAEDRGNYPVISFEDPQGGSADWFPAVAAARGPDVVFGWDAIAAQQDPAATAVRSIKRFLQDAGPSTQVHIGEARVSMIDLLTGRCAALRDALVNASSLKYNGGDDLDVMLGVPANANGNQRFLTVEAFRRAGFRVMGLLNEPSAASIECSHGAAKLPSDRSLMLVYDLGGGTFDASLVEMEGSRHEVIATEGISSLGGDDFDEVLAELAIEAAGLAGARDSLTQAETFRLMEECRRKKETLHPNTRRVVIELDQAREGWPAATVAVSDFYARAEPMVAGTVHAVEGLLADRETIGALYVTGGASELPLVARVLKEKFGRRVRRSAYARSATAIGLAIHAGALAGYQLQERVTRYFGVWREADAGHRAVFDPLFAKGAPLPAAGEDPLRVSRRYRAVHNIGHFRYLECSNTSADGLPAGDITIWDEIRFPFQGEIDVPVRYLESAPVEVEELYECDASGAVRVTITNLSAGYSRVYGLGRWAQREQPVAPGRKKARSARAARSR